MRFLPLRLLEATLLHIRKSYLALQLGFFEDNTRKEPLVKFFPGHVYSCYFSILWAENPQTFSNTRTLQKHKKQYTSSEWVSMCFNATVRVR